MFYILYFSSFWAVCYLDCPHLPPWDSVLSYESLRTNHLLYSSQPSININILSHSKYKIWCWSAKLFTFMFNMINVYKKGKRYIHKHNKPLWPNQPRQAEWGLYTTINQMHMWWQKTRNYKMYNRNFCYFNRLI